MSEKIATSKFLPRPNARSAGGPAGLTLIVIFTNIVLVNSKKKKRNKIISYFHVLNSWLDWPPFLFIVVTHLLFEITFTDEAFLCVWFLFWFFSPILRLLYLWNPHLMSVSVSESVALLWFSDVVHNEKRRLLKAWVNRNNNKKSP